jgi:hypothetical protein
MVLSRGAFRPGPGRYPPPFGQLAKRHCKYCAGLRNLLAAHFERHGCGNDHIRALTLPFNAYNWYTDWFSERFGGVLAQATPRVSLSLPAFAELSERECEDSWPNDRFTSL